MTTSIYEQELVLLEDLRNGNQAAFSWLYEKYRLPLMALALSLLKNEDEAADLVQDFFVGFWEKKSYQKIDPSKQTPGATGFIKPYLYRSICNRCFDKMGQNKSISKKALHLPAQDSMASPEQKRLEKEWDEQIRIAVADAIRKVPPLSARVFELSYLEGKSRNEIAIQMGISPHTVKNQLGRAIKILRVSLKNISL